MSRPRRLKWADAPVQRPVKSTGPWDNTRMRLGSRARSNDMVKVLVFGLTLRDAVGEHEIEVECDGPTTVKKLVEGNQDKLGALLQFMAVREVLIAVNKKVSTEDSAVKDGDVVKLSYQSRTSYDGTRDIPT